MFEGFKLGAARVTGGSIRFRLGGSGPPLLLLHGHPRTHTTWHKVAEHLGSTLRWFAPICRASAVRSSLRTSRTMQTRRSAQRRSPSSS